jgi:membrane protein DedA with SNARE-associated domain
MTLLGYFLGRIINPKSVDKIALLIIFISVLPLVFEYLRHRNSEQTAPDTAKSETTPRTETAEH